jgi:hypothetical protein
MRQAAKAEQKSGSLLPFASTVTSLIGTHALNYAFPIPSSLLYSALSFLLCRFHSALLTSTLPIILLLLSLFLSASSTISFFFAFSF